MTPEHRPAPLSALRLSIAALLALGPTACQTDDGLVIRESTRDLPTFFLGDESHDVQLEPGRLQLSITIEGEASTVDFELQRIDP